MCRDKDRSNNNSINRLFLKLMYHTRTTKVLVTLIKAHLDEYFMYTTLKIVKDLSNTTLYNNQAVSL
jgi:hypothetical protein